IELRHEPVPFLENVEARLPNWTGIPREVVETIFTGWYRYRPRDHFDDPIVDAGRALVVMDMLVVAASLRAHPDTMVFAPTLALSAQFHRPAPPGWFLVNVHGPIAEGGLIYGRGHAWAQGKTVASFDSQSLCLGEPQLGRRSQRP